MTTGKPLWRRGVEAADRVAAPVLEAAVNHEAFSVGMSALEQSRRAIQRRTERMSRRFLHSLNLPTASDVHRLLAHITAVENAQRTLNARLEELPPRPDRRALAPRQDADPT